MPNERLPLVGRKGLIYRGLGLLDSRFGLRLGACWTILIRGPRTGDQSAFGRLSDARHDLLLKLIGL